MTIAVMACTTAATATALVVRKSRTTLQRCCRSGPTARVDTTMTSGTDPAANANAVTRSNLSIYRSIAVDNELMIPAWSPTEGE